MRFSTPALTVDSRRGVAVETPKGSITARAVIITVSANVIASGAVKFTPDLTPSQLDMFGKFALGSFDHVALALADNPLGFESDDLVFEKSADKHTAAILANVGGTPLCLIQIAGSFGRELSAQGGAAMVDFAADWLAQLYGADVKKAVRRSHATRWNHDPLTLGAFSAAAPGWQKARHMLMPPVNNSVWFAGEALHETLWGTVGGAWESGERAADAVLHRLGGGKEAPVAEAPQPGRPRPRAPARPAARNRGNAKPVRALSRAETSYARSTPPVRLPTSATILAASASISASVMVLSRGCSVTAIAIDFLPGSMPLPS